MKVNRMKSINRRRFALKLLSLVTVGLVWSGSLLPAAAGVLLGADPAATETVRQYTFKEVGDLAEINSHDIIKQEADLAKAELQEEESSTSFQIAVFEYWYNGGDGDETSSAYSALYSLQNSYENAYANAVDAETALDQLKPKVRYDAEDLYIALIMGEKNIALQTRNLELVKTARDLEAIKLIFGKSTASALEAAEQKVKDAENSMASLRDTQAINKESMRIYLDLPEGAAFALASPPELGVFQTVFKEEDVQENALANSLSLEQAKRNLEDLDQQIKDYDTMGKSTQSEQLSISARSTELSYAEAVSSLKSKVVSTLDALTTAKENLAAAKIKADRAEIDYLTSKLSYDIGKLTQSGLLSAEQNKTSAAADYEQAGYDYYFASQKVSLLNQGILTN